jgi:pimeloyl-ACP methyl ester carboxylesterase
VIGMPAVFVHGVPERAAIWDELRAHLQRDDHIAVGLPGFMTPVPEGFACTKDEYVDWLTAGIESLAAGAGPVDLVGHDWGGLLVLRVASTRPDLLRSWCTDAAGLFDGEAVWHPLAELWQTEGAGERFMAEAEAASEEYLAEALLTLGVPRGKTSLCSPSDPVMNASILKLYRSSTDNLAAWGAEAKRAAECPGLVLHGEHDLYQREKFCRKVVAVTGAQHHVLPGLGHWWLIEDPKGGAERLERFWKELG